MQKGQALTILVTAGGLVLTIIGIHNTIAVLREKSETNALRREIAALRRELRART